MRSDKEFLEITKELESHHEIFSKLWQLGKPTITTEVETAAVGWNQDGACVAFMFNPDFLDKLETKDVCFIVAHECMHVILNHGMRLHKLIPLIGNVAADITINELLLNGFGFQITDYLRDEVGLCTIKSVFRDKASDIQKNREFEYYYQKLLDDPNGEGEDGDEDGECSGGHGMKSLDDHGKLPMGTPQVIKEIIESINKQDVETLKDQIKAELGKQKDNPDKGRGDGHVLNWIDAILKPKAKEDWRKVIQDWTIKQYREKKRTQWKRCDRRFVDIQRRMPDLVIPSIGPIDSKFAERIDMVFFMDVSGSCHGQSQSFFAAAKTIPDDKFIIDAYAFDTKVTPIDLEANKLPMGGGTSFHQLETHCLSLSQYPSAVFVLTDGDGTPVTPRYPERWHIFLTPNGYKRDFLGGCNFHEFKDFNGNA